MKVTDTAISLNVPDVEASAEFAKAHFGFVETMSSDGFVALKHPGGGLNVVFLATGLPTFKPAEIAGPAGQGLLIALFVDNIDAEFDRVAGSGARVLTRPETEPWGERFCQFADPNGIVWQLVQWVN